MLDEDESEVPVSPMGFFQFTLARFECLVSGDVGGSIL